MHHIPSNMASSTPRPALITQPLAPQTVARLLSPIPTTGVQFTPTASSPGNLAQAAVPSAVTNTVVRQLSLPGRH